MRELESAPAICSPLSVVESSAGKKRLVVNLRHLNRFLYKCKFKYEDLCVAMLRFKKGDYMFSFDLKSGYHHIDIAEAYQKYLEFSWGGGSFMRSRCSHLDYVHLVTCSQKLCGHWFVIGEPRA